MRDLVGKRVFLDHDDRVGFLLDDGDLQNLFNNGGPRGAGADAVITAIDNGARTLDAFDRFLPKYYAAFGFEEIGRLRFNREFAPAGWDYAKYGEPDVIFMVRRASTPKTRPDSPDAPGYVPSTRYFDDYEAAKAAQREYLRNDRGTPRRD